MVEQSIEYVRGISYGRVDHLGVKRGVLVGYVGVEEHSRFGAVTKIDLARLLPAATGPELLSVGGRSSAFAPMCRKGLAVLVIHEAGQCLDIVAMMTLAACGCRGGWSLRRRLMQFTLWLSRMALR